MIEAPLVGLEWCTNHLLKNHETISQIDYNYIFRGNKLGHAPNRFSYLFLRTVILLFDMKETSFVYRTKEVFFVMRSLRNVMRTACVMRLRL